MSNLHNDRYDEMKSLLKKSRMLTEQAGTQYNVAADVEDRIEQDVDAQCAHEERA
jgi:transcriptional regulatory protein LevR